MASFSQKIKNSLTILGISFKLIWHDKRYLIFPLIDSAGMFIILLISFCIVFSTHGTKWFSKDFFDALSNIDKALFILVSLAVAFMFELFSVLLAATIANYTMQHLQTSQGQLERAFSDNISRLWLFVKYSMIAAIISTILGILKDKQKEKSQSNLVASILIDFAGLSWRLATFFIAPVLAFENLNAISSIKRSAHLMKNTFGESITATFAFGLITFSAVMFSSIILFILSILFITYVLTPIGIVSKSSSAAFAVSFSLIVLNGMIIINLVSTASTIFKTAVYAYANGRTTGIFPIGLIKTSFENK